MIIFWYFTIFNKRLSQSINTNMFLSIRLIPRKAFKYIKAKLVDIKKTRVK